MLGTVSGYPQDGGVFGPDGGCAPHEQFILGVGGFVCTCGQPVSCSWQLDGDGGPPTFALKSGPCGSDLFDWVQDAPPGATLTCQ
jgi:hypothetical protein